MNVVHSPYAGAFHETNSLQFFRFILCSFHSFLALLLYDVQFNGPAYNVINWIIFKIEITEIAFIYLAT